MNGAESIVASLRAAEVDHCFMNPGTTEMHLMAALAAHPDIRCIPTLFEGVATGAADGYARMAGRPATTLLHCGPGFANGLANLHNARRARTPLVNLVGDHSHSQRPLDPPLTADVEGWAGPVSIWVRRSRDARTAGLDAAQAVRAAREGSGVATLILPSDVAWDQGGQSAAALPPAAPDPVDAGVLEEAARLLRSSGPHLILLAGAALREPSLSLAFRLAGAAGADLKCEQFNAHCERGRGRPEIPPIPYVIEEALAALSRYRTILLLGAREPASFFAYPGLPGRLAPPEATIVTVTRPEQDARTALEALVDMLRAPEATLPEATPVEAPEPGTTLTPAVLARVVTRHWAEGTIVVDESISNSAHVTALAPGAAPHDWLQLTGGAIGSGLPMATGAAVAAPGRRVLNLEGDGSAMYTVQALWTQARENLDVTTVIMSNRRYAILGRELHRLAPGTEAESTELLNLSRPDLDWLRLAAGMGVEGARAKTAGQMADLLTQANRRKGPFLIEACL